MATAAAVAAAAVALLHLGVVILVQSSVAFSQSQACSSADLLALKSFSEGLKSGPISGWVFPNSSSSSSSSSTLCCEWDGITCASSSTTSSRVVEINLPNRGLKGSISPSLADLDQLTMLSLDNNSLSGDVPQTIFRLQNLRTLNLSMNNFSGEIPGNTHLPAIEVFNISNNGFTGSTPPVLAGASNLREFDGSSNRFGGSLNATAVCSASPAVEVVSFSSVGLTGAFPVGFGSCRFLKKLSLDCNRISGSLPDDLFQATTLEELYLQDNLLSGTIEFDSYGISNLSNLVVLDISTNGFSGKIPDVFGGLEKLQSFSASSNRFNGSLPSSMSNSSSIQVINLRNNSLSGKINLSFTKMVSLSSIDLGSNQLSGEIPPDLSSCTNLKTVNLARNYLAGEIPESFKNLTQLSFLSLSNNSLTNISSALRTLQHCPNLTSLVLTMNFHGEAMPEDGIEGFDLLQTMVIANCDLWGQIPRWLSKCTKLELVDLSWNRLDGNISSWFGDFERLFYLDLSNNSLVGEIPRSLTTMKSFVSSGALQSSSSSDFPLFSSRNNRTQGLQYNQLNSFPPSLFLSWNKLEGSIWPQFGNLKKLHVLDLSNNDLTGTIPDELANMTSLEILELSHNNLTGIIPNSLSNLSFLREFSVAYNNLTGPIPYQGQFSTFPNSSFYGNPLLCRTKEASCSAGTLVTSSTTKKGKNKGFVLGVGIGIGCGALLIFAIVYMVLSRTLSKRVEDTEREVVDLDSEGGGESSSCLVVLFQNKDRYKMLTVDDILKSTNNFDQANIIGCGGFGLVYKATLPDGRKVAIKRLSGNYGQMEREFQAEVETLSSAQHKNLVLLQGYCRVGNDRLLIYTYMENGSLDYWLHEKLDGELSLDWETRLRIARGAAMGLAHLHQSCQPHILHRDIKSSNILLDAKFEARLADFGLARLILPYDTHVTTDLVGTLGYIPPEYGQSSVATFKGDVYSFGVVLLELLTGRRPMDMCKARESRNLISWVFHLKKEKREKEVFDPFIYDKHNENQLLQVLEVACLCLSDSPKLRPTIQQIVSWLDDISINEQLAK